MAVYFLHVESAAFIKPTAGNDQQAIAHRLGRASSKVITESIRKVERHDFVIHLKHTVLEYIKLHQNFVEWPASTLDKKENTYPTPEHSR